MPLPACRRSGHVVAPYASELYRMSHSALPKHPIILIPTRLAAARLPRKPLADVAGSRMVLHVWRRAVAADLGPVVVASGDREIADIVEREGGRAVLTEPDLPTGSDRIHAAITALDPERHHDAVVNVQGDMPMLDPPRSGLRSKPSPIPKPISRRSRRRSPIRPPSRIRASTRSSPALPTLPAPRARFISRRRSCRGARGRITSISASTPTAAPRWSAL